GGVLAAAFDLAGCGAGVAHQVRYADAAIAVAKQMQSDECLHAGVELGHPLQMADAVLREAPWPATDYRDLRLGERAEDACQLEPRDSSGLVVPAMHHALGYRASEERAQEAASLRDAVSKFLIDEGTGEQTAAGTGRHKEAKSRWNGESFCLGESKRNDDG